MEDLIQMLTTDGDLNKESRRWSRLQLLRDWNRQKEATARLVAPATPWQTLNDQLRVRSSDLRHRKVRCSHNCSAESFGAETPIHWETHLTVSRCFHSNYRRCERYLANVITSIQYILVLLYLFFWQLRWLIFTKQSRLRRVIGASVITARRATAGIKY